VLREWADDNSVGDDAGIRLRYAVESGEPLKSQLPPQTGGGGGTEVGAEPSLHFGGHFGGGGEGSWMGAPAGSAETLLKDGGGRVGCAFSNRNLASCALPVCTSDWCHVRMELEPPADAEQVARDPDDPDRLVIDVPWTVVYGGDKGLAPWRPGKAVTCDAVTKPPFDSIVECMSRTVS
jgi:hypothetical protein